MGNAKRNLIKQQESIPVGYVPPAFVVPGMGVGYLGDTLDILLPWIPYPPEGIRNQKRHGTIHAQHRQTDKNGQKYYPPATSLAGGKMCYICRACVRFIQNPI